MSQFNVEIEVNMEVWQLFKAVCKEQEVSVHDVLEELMKKFAGYEEE